MRIYAYNDEYKSLLRSAEWRRLRRLKLAVNPCCEACASRRVFRYATEVHHRVPVMSAPVSARRILMFDMNNLVSLCHECHVAEHRALGKQTAADKRRRDEAALRAFADKFGL